MKVRFARNGTGSHARYIMRVRLLSLGDLSIVSFAHAKTSCCSSTSAFASDIHSTFHTRPPQTLLKQHVLQSPPIRDAPPSGHRATADPLHHALARGTSSSFRSRSASANYASKKRPTLKVYEDGILTKAKVPGRRCPTCASKGSTVWVIPGKKCPQCGTLVN